MIAYPLLEQFIVVDVSSGAMVILNMPGLNKHIAMLMRQSLQRLRLDAEDVEDCPE